MPATGSSGVSRVSEPQPAPATRAEPARYAIPGRCILEGGDEFVCEARAITLDRADIVSRARVADGETVVCYLDNVGLVRGSVRACRAGGFTLALDVAGERRTRVAARLEWHAARAREAVEQRAAPRIVPLHRAVELRLGESLAAPGTIIDLSLSGAAITLEAGMRPFVGSLVQVGRRFATVVRLLDDGIAVQFKLPFIPDAFNERVVL